jgi:hypothetical protein
MIGSGFLGRRFRAGFSFLRASYASPMAAACRRAMASRRPDTNLLSSDRDWSEFDSCQHGTR